MYEQAEKAERWLFEKAEKTWKLNIWKAQKAEKMAGKALKCEHFDSRTVSLAAHKAAHLKKLKRQKSWKVIGLMA